MPDRPASSALPTAHNLPILSQLRTHPNRPPSPATTAAAMSLGALAAAASMASAAPSPPPSSLPPPPSLPSLPPHFHPPYPQQRSTAFLPPIIPVPAMSQLARPKPSPTPVAPAPSNMHPSQQPVSTHPNGKPKQRRYRATPEQLRQLIALFDVNPSPSSAELQLLAAKINMPAQSAVLWFKNRRARVPHKKGEKGVAVKLKVTQAVPPTPVSNTFTAPPTVSKLIPEKPTLEIPKSIALPSSTSDAAEVAAAACMAEMAMAPQDFKVARKAGRNITNQEKPVDAIPLRSPSRSPPPLYRNRASDAVPFDIGLVSRLSSGNKNGAEFATPTTMRRPRGLPPTPRLSSQKEYDAGDKVEVLETSKGICRSWYAAKIVGRVSLKELSLGESAATLMGQLPKMGGTPTRDNARGENAMVDEEHDTDGGDSPRTVRSPAAGSATPPIAKVTYLVEYEHRFEDTDRTKNVQEEVMAVRIRPASPYSLNMYDWRPETGEAVEVLRDGAWFVAVTQAFAVRKGYMVSFESGDVQWVRRYGLRPYQIWRGGDSWVTKTKPPLPVVRKSVGLSVTHPPGGKRKRSSPNGSGGCDGSGLCGSDGLCGSGCGESREGCETRGRSKRARSVSIDGSGPDGLPEGWRRMISSGEMRKSGVYIAPDGHRLRSLKEAQRYVKLMGPG